MTCLGQTRDWPAKVCFDDQIDLSIRGNIVEMDDKSLLAPFYGRNYLRKGASCFVLKTKDKGKTWEKLSEVFTEEGYDLVEPNLIRTESGKLVMFMRSHKIGDTS